MELPFPDSLSHGKVPIWQSWLLEGFAQDLEGEPEAVAITLGRSSRLDEMTGRHQGASSALVLTLLHSTSSFSYPLLT